MLSEEEIINGCKQYNKAAQMALYKKHVGKMSSVCYRYVNSYDDAKDIVQDGFIKVFSSIDKYKGEGSLEGWIRRIMVNTALDYLKKKKMFVSIQSLSSGDGEQDGGDIANPEEEEDNESLFNAGFTSDELMNAINQLPDQYRLIFNMHCIEKYSHKEISNLLSIKEETSRSRLRRARASLKETLSALLKTKKVNS